MNRKVKNTLAGAGIGFLAGCAMTGARLASAATAPLTYPAIGAVTSAVSYVGVMTHVRPNLNDFTTAALVEAGATFSAVAGAAWGTICIPTAIFEPVLAPLTAIPTCTIMGGFIGSKQ